MPVAASRASSVDEQDGQSAPLAGLVLVSTPIGNLGDVSGRARATLAACDLVLCEDTRRTGRLLGALNIQARMETLHDYNEDSRIESVLTRLRAHEVVALVSDAGTPLVSDPGYRLVRATIAAGLPVSATPGPSAVITAVILSGLPPVPFLFLGFAPPKQAARRATFSTLRAAERAGLSTTLVWHEAPHRLLDMLGDVGDIFGNRSAAVARELTKRFETVERGTVSELAETFTRQPPRGEITVVVGPPETDDPEDLDGQLRLALATQTVKDAAALVSTATGLPRKIVYARALQIHEES